MGHGRTALAQVAQWVAQPRFDIGITGLDLADISDITDA